MEKMLTEVCHEVNNYFHSYSIRTTYAVEEGHLVGLPDDFLQENQYFQIVGSVFNDGVHKFSDELTLTNENAFLGNVWSLAIPQEFLDLVSEISDWVEKYGGTDSAALSPFTSESFGGYSYSKTSSGNSSDDFSEGVSWKSVFASRLNKWRRMRGII